MTTSSPRAFCFIRDLPHYRRESFVEGLRAAGFSVVFHELRDPQPGEVVVIWNRYGHYDDAAKQAERAGATVLVSENGFAGRDSQGRQFYQLAIGGHNGSGVWYVGEGSRLEALGLSIKPWQPADPEGPVIVRGQRGIGRPGVASPANWHHVAANYLRERTKRKVVVVEHPGSSAVEDLSHNLYLRGAQALAIWSSSVGVKALLAGVPVLCASPYWVCKSAGAALSEVESEALRCEERDALRRAALERMAWAQWSLEEIASGFPIRHLLDHHHQRSIPKAEERA